MNDSKVILNVKICELLICNLLILLVGVIDGRNDWPVNGQSFLLISLIYIVCTWRNGVILHRLETRKFQVVYLVFKIVAILFLVECILHYLAKVYLPGVKWTLIYFCLLLVCLTSFRLYVYEYIRRYRSIEKNQKKVVFVGITDDIKRLMRELTTNVTYGYKACGYFSNEEDKDVSSTYCPWLGTPSDVEQWLAENKGICELFCGLQSSRNHEIFDIIRYCENHLIHFSSVANVLDGLNNRIHATIFCNVPVFSLHEEPLRRPENAILKRLFDIVFSLLFLCTLFPVVFIIVSIITKLTMPGPIFFRQKRNGLNNKEFYVLKFRSMVVNKDADTRQATQNDPRITCWGNILRHSNIDELPQFINVLLGDMSVVGPRPHMVKHTIQYSKTVDRYMLRHSIKPGITGWSQVTGYRGDTTEISQMEGRIKGDIWYMENWTFGLDLFIIYKTLINMLKGDKNAV